MSGYRVRPATLDDIDALVRHRLGMFTEMGTSFDAPLIGGMFRAWLREMMPAGEYRAWLCETDTGEIAAGAGITLLRWPPWRSMQRRPRNIFTGHWDTSTRRAP